MADGEVWWFLQGGPHLAPASMKPLVCLGLLLLLTPYLATRTAAASPETPDDSSDLEQSPKEQVSSSERSSDSPQAHADIEVDTPRQASSEASSEEPSTPPLAKAGLSIEGPAGASLSGQAALTVEQPSAKASTSQEPAQSSPKETPSSPQEESSSSEESESGLPFRIVMNDGPSGEQAVRPPRMSGALDLSNIISINDAEESPATSEAASTVASEEKATAKPSHAAAPSAAHAPAAAKKTAASAAGAKPAAGSAAARAAQAAAARRARLAAMRRAAASGGASHTPTNKKVVPTMTQVRTRAASSGFMSVYQSRLVFLHRLFSWTFTNLDSCRSIIWFHGAFTNLDSCRKSTSPPGAPLHNIIADTGLGPTPPFGPGSVLFGWYRSLRLSRFAEQWDITTWRPLRSISADTDLGPAPPFGPGNVLFAFTFS